MIKNYIEFKFDEYGLLVAKISQNGKCKYIRNLDNIFKLIDIAEKYGYTVDGEIRIVKDARNIINDYYNLKRKKDNKKKLKIYNNIDKKMVVSRKQPTVGKKVAAFLLASTMALTAGVPLSKSLSNKSNEDDKDIVEGKYVISQEYEPENIYDYVEEYEYTDQTAELKIMTSEDTFHYAYEDRTDSENIDNVNQYDDIFQKYAKMYGLDVKLLKAIACQESGGNHYGNLGNGPAEGIMQIEKSVHIGETISAYNFYTQDMDYVSITDENLQDIDFNIRVGAMELRNAMESFNYNIPQATQAYNFGVGGMNQTLAICSRNIGEPQEKLEKSPTNNAWLNFREVLSMGDPEYVEHTYSYLPNHTTLTVLDREGIQHYVTITNDYVKKNIK